MYASFQPKMKEWSKELRFVSIKNIIGYFWISETDKVTRAIMVRFLSSWTENPNNSNWHCYEGKKAARKKPFDCGICEEIFAENQELNSHIAAVHEGKRPQTIQLWYL